MTVRYPIGVPVAFDCESRRKERRKKYKHPMVLRETNGKYWLIYDRRQKTGTGAFTSARKAKGWYERNGR